MKTDQWKKELSFDYFMSYPWNMMDETASLVPIDLTLLLPEVLAVHVACSVSHELLTLAADVSPITLFNDFWYQSSATLELLSIRFEFSFYEICIFKSNAVLFLAVVLELLSEYKQ